MIVLISPSKTQDFVCRNLSAYTTPACLSQTWKLVHSLQKLSAHEIGNLMQISPKLAELNFKRFQNFKEKFDLTTAKQALLAFRGDVYNGITVDSYAKDDFDFAQGHLRIVSGLYGILKPLDLIQPYRLEMGTKLAVEGAANLYQFWESRLTDIVSQNLQAIGSSQVINLASNEYFKAIMVKKLKATVVSIAFKEKKGDAFKVVAIHAKRARGFMADYIIKNKLTEAEGLQSFSANGYKFNPTMSSEREFVFCRG